MKRLSIWILIFMVNISYAQEVTEPTAEVALGEAAVPGTITFSFKDADIRNVLRLISAKSGVNIIAGPEVTGLVNMELKDVLWEQALGYVLDINGCAYQREGNVIKVLKKEDITKEPLATEVFVLSYVDATQIVGLIEPMCSERGKVTPLEKKVKRKKDGGEEEEEVWSNTIIVTDVLAKINEIQKVIEELDTRTPQVLIETKIVEISNTKQKDLGLKWTSLKEYKLTLKSPTRTYGSERSGGQARTDKYTITSEDKSGSGTSATITSDPITGTISGGTQTDTATISSTDVIGRALTDTFTRMLTKSDIRSAVLSASDFELVLSALESQADVDLISNPRILTANNETAQIRVVQEYPIPRYTFDTTTSTFMIAGFDYKDIGVVFDVTPTISADGYITMKIKPKTSVLLGTIPFTAGNATVNVPLIGIKEASAKLVIRSSDTLAVGGLVDEDKTNVVTKVPLLGDLPVLGRLFRHDSVANVKKDVIFFITATVIDEETKRLIYEEEASQVVETPPEVYSKVFGTSGDKDLSKGNRGFVGK